MKYPRITYAELLDTIAHQSGVRLWELIYPFMYDIEGSDVDDVLQGLGYTTVDTPRHACEQFEQDYLAHSADKVISHNAVVSLLTSTANSNISLIARGYVTSDDIKTCIETLEGYSLERVVKQFMSRSWLNIKKVFDAYTTQYKPLENYSMIEDTDYTPLAKQTVKTSNKSKTDTTTDVGVFGFNSTVAVPSSSTDSGTTQLKADNEMETETSYDGKADNTHHERSGNIGVTTSQQMLESEIKLRKLEILELIFQGLDEVICKSVYD